jgi:hypothetical protein
LLQEQLLAGIGARDWGDVDLLLDTLRAIDASATEPAAAPLAELLRSPEELHVRLACHGLALIGPGASAAAPALAKQLDPSRPQLAALAARALGHIGPGARITAGRLVTCLQVDDPDLSFQAARALCRIAPADAPARAATIKAVMSHPWFVRLGGSTSARRNCYRSIALAYLGKDAIPQFLAQARAILASNAKAAKGSPRPDYTGICELAGAAFIVDRGSAADFLPVLAKIPDRNPPVVDRTLLRLTREDLEGTLDQRDPLGRLAARARNQERE